MIASTRNIPNPGWILNAIDVVRPATEGISNESNIYMKLVDHIQAILTMMQCQPGAEYISHSDRIFLNYLSGNIEIQNSASIKTIEGLLKAHTPGVCASLSCDSSKSRGCL